MALFGKVADVVKKITVLLVDDHKLVRSGFRRIIEDEDGLIVIGETGDGAHAVQIARELQPSVALMDYSLPGIDGFLAARRMIASSPGTAVLIVSMHADEGHVTQAFRAGARGYAVKNVEDIHLISAIRRVVGGDLVFPYGLASQNGRKLPPDNLSPREARLSNSSPRERLTGNRRSPGSQCQHRVRASRKHYEDAAYSQGRGIGEVRHSQRSGK